jgi:peptidoglycan/LPS O-acetylase OafA/YrhL
VIVSHVWPLGGYGEDPGTGPDTSNLGGWAVAGFFGISGYLITGSRLNSRSLVDYMWRRVLRIYPGFIVAIVLVGLVISPIGAAINPRNVWSIGAALRFIAEALPLWMRQYAPAGSLTTVQFPDVWVGTLWTLGHEFACYLVIGLLATLVRNRRVLLWCVVGWLVLSTGVTVAHELLGTSEISGVARFARLGAFFAAGALVYLLRDRVPVSHLLGVVAAAAVVALILTGRFSAFAGIPVAYLMLYLGTVLPLSWIGSKNDISYGMYIWGWPVEQLLVLATGARVLPLPLFLVLSIALSVPLAWASWLLVERPAMRWKRLTAGRRPDREGRVLPLPHQKLDPADR